MSTTELKYNLFKAIDSINDSKTLKDIYSLISKSTKKDFWDTLSKAERKSIEQGLAQADKGELISHKEVMAEIKSKFNL